MGVQNLWKLLAAAGRTVDKSSLQGMSVAIDVSIWMIKILHGMTKAGVKNFSSAHLIGIMKRVIQLFEYGMKPVFVFDGPPPELKRQTLIHRQQQRTQFNINIQKLAEKYVVRLMEKGIQPQMDEIDNQDDEQLKVLEQMVNENQEKEEIDEEEQEINLQKQNDLIDLQYQYYNGNIDFEDFQQLTLEEKIQLLSQFEPNEKVPNVNEFVRRAEIAEKIRQVKIEAKRQIELLRIEKILSKYDDEESELLREYVRNNEDLNMKLGNLGVQNIYLYLEDQYARKQLVEKIFGKNNKKKKKLKGWQKENENLNAIREKIRKRYQMKNQQIDQENQQMDDEEQQQNQENQHDNEIFDNYDSIINLDDLENKLLNDIQLQNNQEQINENQSESENESERESIIEIVSNKSNDQSIRNNLENQISENSDLPMLIELQQQKENNQISDEEKVEKKNLSHDHDDNQNQFSPIQDNFTPQNFNVEFQIEQQDQQKIDQQPNQIDLNQNEQKSDKQQLRLNEDKQQINPQINQLKQTQQEAITDEQMDEIFHLLENQDENISTDEMLQAIERYQNLNKISDFGSLQTKFEEVRYLLQLFGIPYIIAPGESEAQCAFLQQKKLVDLIITEDSDVFLFGGTQVLKGFFEGKNFEYVSSEFIQEELGLNREKLILMALFLGSDYTVGIKGVGIVNAMEIVQAFENVEALKRFAQWASKADILIKYADKLYENISEKERLFQEMHKNYKKYWELPNNFPNEVVINAYLKPLVDESLEQFQWNNPDLEKIETFCKQVLDWTGERTQLYVIDPLKKCLEKNKEQRKITDYFRVQQKVAFINSKRIISVVQKMRNPDGNHVSSREKRQQLQNIYREKKKKEQKIKQFKEEVNELDLDNFQYKKEKKD